MDNYYPCPGNPAVRITQANVRAKSLLLLNQFRKKSLLYGDDNSHNVIVVPLGDDFRYVTLKEAHDQYENYELLMDYMNNQPDFNVNVRFGTLKDYFELAAPNTRGSLETLSGDFFTYADDTNSYWSGYFTSRPFYKRLDRVVESYVRSADILFTHASLLRSFRNESAENVSALENLLLEARRNLGIFQHHDGITGTARKAVMLDYEKK